MKPAPRSALKSAMGKRFGPPRNGSRDGSLDLYSGRFYVPVNSSPRRESGADLSSLSRCRGKVVAENAAAAVHGRGSSGRGRSFLTQACQVLGHVRDMFRAPSPSRFACLPAVGPISDPLRRCRESLRHRAARGAPAAFQSHLITLASGGAADNGRRDSGTCLASLRRPVLLPGARPRGRWRNVSPNHSKPGDARPGGPACGCFV